MPNIGIGFGLTMQRRGGRRWLPSDVFLPGDNGFLYDFSRADALFQEATGTTPAGVDQNVGLALDISKWGGKTLAQVLAAAVPVFTADFASGIAGWSAINQAVLSNSAGKLRIEPKVGNSYGAASSPSFATVVGRSYQLSIEISPAGATNTTVRVDGADILPAASRNGTYTAVFRALATTSTVTAIVNNASGVAASFDNISVKEIPGNHASQTTSGARPVRKAGLTRYDGSDDNLLTTFKFDAGGKGSLALKFNKAVGNSSQILIGARNASTDDVILVLEADGRILANVGTGANLTGGSNRAGQTAIAVLTWDGTTVNLYSDEGLLASQSQSGSVTIADAVALAASSVASLFASVDIYQALAINRALTPAEITKLTNAWSNT